MNDRRVDLLTAARAIVFDYIERDYACDDRRVAAAHIRSVQRYVARHRQTLPFPPTVRAVRRQSP
jgi:hypothetical protein